MTLVRSSRLLVAGIATVAMLGSCGDAIGPESARLEAILRDHPGTAAAAPTSAQVAGPFLGDLTTDANVEVSTDGSTWLALGSPNGITVKLQSSRDSSTVHGEVDAPAGAYARVRVTLRNARAIIKAGGTVGGQILAADAQLALGGSDGVVVIERELSGFTLRPGGRASLVFELNSEVWVTSTSLARGEVEDAAVVQATQFRAAERGN